MSSEVVTLSGEAVPPPLAAADPPAKTLYLCGALPPPGLPRVAIVGSRTPSDSGRWAAYTLGHDLTKAGVVVVSGLARGIDAEAHRGAMDAGGPAVAFLGGAVDRVTPKSSRQLARRVAEGGALLSEYPPGTDPRPHFFVRRNRLIAAFSLVVIVVEAGERSGALITAGFALEAGGDVWVVPGDPRRPTCRGSNRLLRDGAAAVLEAADVLAGLGLLEAASQDGMPVLPLGLNDVEERIWRAVARGATAVEDLVRGTRLPAAVALAALTRLEMTGHLERTRGGYAVRERQ